MTPAKGVRPYREHRRERFLSDEEIGRLGAALHAAEGQIDLFALAAIRLLLFTGCRMREVLDARWDWVDWQRGSVGSSSCQTQKQDSGRSH